MAGSRKSRLSGGECRLVILVRDASFRKKTGKSGTRESEWLLKGANTISAAKQAAAAYLSGLPIGTASNVLKVTLHHNGIAYVLPLKNGKKPLAGIIGSPVRAISKKFDEAPKKRRK